MSKTTFAAATVVMMLAGGSAFADDSSMSRWTGDSYRAFEAARTSAPAAPHAARTLNAIPDNGMSQYKGDSYEAFAAARGATGGSVTTAATREAARTSREAPVRTATRGRHRLDAFRDDTAG